MASLPRHLLGALVAGAVLLGPVWDTRCRSVGAVWADGPDAAERLAAAERALAEGSSPEAVAGFRTLLTEAVAAHADAASLAPLQRGLGRALLQAGESYAALEPLEALARGGGPADFALYAEGLLAHVRSVVQDAGVTSAQVTPYLEDARRALARIPEEQAVATHRAWLEGDLAYLGGRYADAVAAWAAAPTSAPSNWPETWYRERQAHALYLLGRHRESAAIYESLGNARAAASAWAAARDGAKALAHYATLLAATPGDATLLDDALAAARYTSTQAQLEVILAGLTSTDPATLAAWAVARSRLAQQRGDHAAAAEVLRQLLPTLEAAPHGHLCYELAASLLLDPNGGEPARVEAAEVLLKGWSAEPGRPELARLMGLMAEQDFRAAPRAWPVRRPLERALALTRALAAGQAEDPFALGNLGNVARLAGEDAEAVRSLRAASALVPGDAATQNDLGLALLSAGQTAEAEATFRGVIESDPAFRAARQNLARLLRPYAGQAGSEARRLLLGAEVAARASAEPSTLYRALALRAWRSGRGPAAR